MLRMAMPTGSAGRGSAAAERPGVGRAIEGANRLVAPSPGAGPSPPPIRVSPLLDWR